MSLTAIRMAKVIKSHNPAAINLLSYTPTHIDYIHESIKIVSHQNISAGHCWTIFIWVCSDISSDKNYVYVTLHIFFLHGHIHIKNFMIVDAIKMTLWKNKMMLYCENALRIEDEKLWDTKLCLMFAINIIFSQVWTFTINGFLIVKINFQLLGWKRYFDELCLDHNL